MGKSLDSAQGVGVAVFGLEYDFGKHGRRSATLSGNTEFFFEIVADIRNRFDEEFVFHSNIIISLSFSLVKSKNTREIFHRQVKRIEII